MSAQADCGATDGALRSAMREAITALEPSFHPDSLGLADAMSRFYSANSFEPYWFDSRCRPLLGREVLAVLFEASTHGIDPHAYSVVRLSTLLSSVARQGSVPPSELVEIDLALTAALFRYLAHLHGGRVDPRQLVPNFTPADDKLDLSETVRHALVAGSLQEAVDAAAPRYPAYRRLRRALERYRALEHGGFREPLSVIARLRPGEPYPALPALRDRLVALGDMTEDAQVPARYTGEIVEAVQRFQERHGLAADGVIGPATFAQLNTPLSHRVRQIELSLERLRWLPRLDAERLIVVNIPEFRVRALDLRRGSSSVLLDMRAIVGRAFVTETPVFLGRVKNIELSPYWNVPASIAKLELVPRLRRDPDYLRREGMEFVSTGNETIVSTEASKANLLALSSGELRLRQRPGPRNVLGGVKFPLSSSSDIYLHGTSDPALFDLTKRDLSHGCIRIEQPDALAHLLLADQGDWTIDRLREAMHTGKPTSVNLSEPVPVLIFYTTAVVEPGGRILFLPDVYGHDRALQRALDATPRPDRRGTSPESAAADGNHSVTGPQTGSYRNGDLQSGGVQPAHPSSLFRIRDARSCASCR